MSHIQPAGLFRSNPGRHHRNMQAVQNPFNLLFPFFRPIQCSQRSFPQDVVRVFVLQKTVLAVSGFPQFHSKRFQGKSRGKWTDIRFHKSAGHIPRVRFTDNPRHAVKGRRGRHDTAAGLCAGTGDHQFLTSQGNRLVNILFSAGSQIHQRLTDLAVRPYLTFQLIRITGIPLIVFPVFPPDKLLQQATLLLGKNARAGRDLILLQSHDNHAAYP